MIPILMRSGAIPELERVRSVRLVTTRIATRLTGLSTDQLREWSSRRALIPADVQNRGRGSPAQYGWQAILLLRIAAQLKDRFHLELHAHRGLFAAMRETLERVSFLRLWGSSLVIYDAETWQLFDARFNIAPRSDAINIRLEPHLAVLAAEFAMPNPATAGQLELFPARLIPADRNRKADAAATDVRVQTQRRA